MKIAMFSDSILPVLNGVSVSIDSLVRELRDHGHSVHLFAPNKRGYHETEPNTVRFRSFDMPFGKGFPIAYPPYLRTLKEFRKWDFDVVHTHTIGVASFVGLRWAQSEGIPIVSTYHTLYDRYAHYFRLLPHRYVRFKIAKHTNYFFNHVDHVITPSLAAERWLKRHSVNTPITIVPTVTQAPKLIDRAEARYTLAVHPDHRVLLFVGRLAEEKNLDLLLRSAKLAMDHDPRIRLWLVGDGPYRNQCRNIATNLGIGDRVKFFGFIPREEIDPYYAAGDLFVFPSSTETQGLVIQEAMSHGLPAVAVDSGGAAAEVVHHENGILVRSDDNQFAQAVTSVLTDEQLLLRLGEAARRSARKNSPEAMMQRVLDVYDAAIHARNQTLTPDAVSHSRIHLS